MQRGLTGHYVPLPSVAGEKARAFIPKPLPPVPAVVIDAELQNLLSQATLGLGRLDGLAGTLPASDLMIYSYVRKEAVLSSQIEGTQSSLDDLLLFENAATPGVPLEDVQEVSNYVAALKFGLQRLKELPISLRLLKEIHRVLLSRGRGSKKEPGEFRRSQNWIGGSRPGNAVFVPPPPDHIVDCLGNLERFLHDQSVKTPVLIKAALAHVQFETIHPFLDGNGRLGRLLIALVLSAEGALREPLLYLSLYFKQHRQEYYRLLQSVRLSGDWESWLRFFLTGVAEMAAEALETARSLNALTEADRHRIHSIGKAAKSALLLHRFLQQRPLVSISAVAKELNLSIPTITASLLRLEELGIVRETTGAKYNRLYAYQRYLRTVSQGTDSPMG